jgi:heavy metal efflux system protein
VVSVPVTARLGGLLALPVTGTSFSVSAGVGFLALFGASVLTGVILVSSINELRVGGVTLDDAIIEAFEMRLRPVIVTALVATLGPVPAAISKAMGSDSQKPLAIGVLGGLSSSRVLSLFLIPLLYKWFAPPAPRVRLPRPEQGDDPRIALQGVTR